MFEWSTQAVEAWSALVTAAAAAIGVVFFLWDRFRLKPHQISGYLAINPKRGEISAYLFSQTGERFIVTEVRGRDLYEFAPADVRTVAARRVSPYAPSDWRNTQKVRWVAERNHLGNSPLGALAVRLRAAAPGRSSGLWLRMRTRLRMWLRSQAWLRHAVSSGVEFRGVLPYQSGRRFRVFLDLADSSLLMAVTRMSQK